jgi:hypothetical protein
VAVNPVWLGAWVLLLAMMPAVMWSLGATGEWANRDQNTSDAGATLFLLMFTGLGVIFGFGIAMGFWVFS